MRNALVKNILKGKNLGHLNGMTTESLPHKQFEAVCHTLAKKGILITDVIYRDNKVVQYYNHLYFMSNDYCDGENIVHGKGNEDGAEMVSCETFVNKLLAYTNGYGYNIYGDKICI